MLAEPLGIHKYMKCLQVICWRYEYKGKTLPALPILPVSLCKVKSVQKKGKINICLFTPDSRNYLTQCAVCTPDSRNYNILDTVCTPALYTLEFVVCTHSSDILILVLISCLSNPLPHKWWRNQSVFSCNVWTWQLWQMLLYDIVIVNIYTHILNLRFSN